MSIVRDIGSLKLTSTSTAVAAAPTNALGHLDDADTVTLFITSSGNALTSGLVIQVSQYDPADSFPRAGVSQSSAWYNVSSSVSYTSGTVITLSGISFRGLRVTVGASGSTAELDEPFIYVSKQISV
jgi:hypothetical protein